MATLVINHRYCRGAEVALFYRNGFTEIPDKRLGPREIFNQRDGYVRTIEETAIFHFHKMPEDSWHLKNLWDHHTTPEELYAFFGYTYKPYESVKIENIDPWICYTENNDIILYFGNDIPRLKTKTTKMLTKHAKMWANHGKWFRDKREFAYKYWDVKDKSKLLFCTESSLHCIFPEIKWGDYYPFGEKDKIDLGPFRASDPYDYSDEEKAEILRKKAEEEKRRQEYYEDLERRKNTPGYCCRCGCEGAEYVMNPYDHDMYNVENYEWLCDDCYESIKGDI